jgi:hypothetical protein
VSKDQRELAGEIVSATEAAFEGETSVAVQPVGIVNFASNG